MNGWLSDKGISPQIKLEELIRESNRYLWPGRLLFSFISSINRWTISIIYWRFISIVFKITPTINDRIATMINKTLESIKITIPH